MIASSAVSTPTPCVRPIQIALRVNMVSTSRSVFGKRAGELAETRSKPSGMSAIMPPTRVRLVVSRAPVHISCRL